MVDPLVMPIGAMGSAGRQVFRLVRRLPEELGVNSTCGASNVSFGLPNRNGLNGAFLTMAIASGMTCAITSPLHEEVRQAVMAADVMMGTDPRLRGVDRAVPRAARRREAAADARRWRRGQARRRRATGGRGAIAAVTDDRGARRLHAVGQAGPVPARDHGAGRGALARRRPGLGMRRTRHLRPLPGRRRARASSRSTASPRDSII